MILVKTTKNSKTDSIIWAVICINPVLALGISLVGGPQWLPVAEICCFLIPGILFVRHSEQQRQTLLGQWHPENAKQILQALFIGLTAIVLAFVAEASLPFWHAIFGEPKNYQHSIQNLLTQTTLVSGLLRAALLPAICEEFFFRVLAQGFAEQKLPKLRALFFAAALFAAAHATPQYFLLYVGLGMIFGLIYRRFGALGAIIAHFCFNATGISMMYFTSQ